MPGRELDPIGDLELAPAGWDCVDRGTKGRQDAADGGDLQKIASMPLRGDGRRRDGENEAGKCEYRRAILSWRRHDLANAAKYPIRVIC